jgi:hypothetical protein
MCCAQVKQRVTFSHVVAGNRAERRVAGNKEWVSVYKERIYIKKGIQIYAIEIPEILFKCG